MQSPQEIFPPNLPIVGIIKTGLRLTWQDRNLRKITGLTILVSLFIYLLDISTAKLHIGSPWLSTVLFYLGYIIAPVYTALVIVTIQSISKPVTRELKDILISSLHWYFPLLVLMLTEFIFGLARIPFSFLQPSKFGADTLYLYNIITCCSTMILVIFMMISIPVCQFGSRALILENLTIWQSIKRGWEVLTKNPGRSIGLYILLYFFAIVLFLIIGFPFLCYAFNSLSQASATQVLPKLNPWVLVPANVLFRIFGAYIVTSLEVILTIAFLNFRLAIITPLDPWNAEAKIISAE